MQYFGVPRCPYCKKRVNLIRTWSLKRQGEYQCPRCGGISNIFLSPLVYVLALLAIFSGGAVYFFHKFVLDDIGLTTCFQVLLPFVIFFLISLFLVYLEKPVIKRVSREETSKKRRGRGKNTSPTGAVYVDQGDYLPGNQGRTGTLPPVQAPSAHRTGTLPPVQAPSAHRTGTLPPVQASSAHRTGTLPPTQSPAPRRVSSAAQPTAVMPQGGTGTHPRTGVSGATAQRRPVSQATAQEPLRPATQQRRRAVAPSQAQSVSGSLPRRETLSPAAQRRQAAQRTAAQGAVSRTQPQETGVHSRVAPVGEQPSQASRQTQAPRQAQPTPAQQAPAWTTVRQERPAQPRTTPQVEVPRQVRSTANPSLAAPRRASHVVSSVEIPDLSDDFFKKYDDPAYVERRLKELQQGDKKD